jgi:hypothetical protein
MRWKVTHASVTGKAHADRGESGQDFCSAHIVRIADNDFFIGIAADGAGSTSDGGQGAEIACGTLFAAMAGAVRACGDLSCITEQDVTDWITASREAIRAEAREHGKQPREYACTVLGALAGNGRAVFFQIGDGAIVVGAGQEYRTIFWPDQGEYANTTYFITDEEFSGHLQFLTAEAPGGIALFTDGLQNLALSYAQKSAHPGFFQPLFDALREATGDGFSVTLERFLQRDDISTRSDDDKTLVLAIQLQG